MAEDLGEKTEDPTSKRRAESREKGQVPRSADYSAAVVLAGAAAYLYVYGAGILGDMGSFMRSTLEPETLGQGVTTGSLEGSVHLAVSAGLGMLVPVMLVMALLALADQFSQVGWSFTTQPLTPKFDRLSPAKGIKNIFSRRSLVKAAINIAKLTVIGSVAILVIRGEQGSIIASPALTPAGAMLLIVQLIIRLGLWILAVLIVIGAIDRAYQIWQHTQDLRMSKQEVKDERKSSEGDPSTKARRMRIAREIARQRLQSAVPKADVVVTNPTHFAVAIQYDPEKMNAPKVVAKGADFLAMQIRLIASANGVAIVERKPLARALYRSVEVGQEVSAELYEAVAEVLAYVYRLEGRVATGVAEAS